jgi:hypothetical protein
MQLSLGPISFRCVDPPSERHGKPDAMRGL